MEPKVIKEESIEKDAPNYIDASIVARTRSTKGKSRKST